MIKTFPIVMSDDYHSKIAEAAKKQGKTLKEYILEAIEEKIQKEMER